MAGADGLVIQKLKKLSDVAEADPMKADAQEEEKGRHDVAGDPAAVVASTEGSMKDPEKPPRRETKEEKEMKRRQREEEREKKRKRDEEERERKRKKKEEAEAKKKAEEEEKEQKRKKREEEKEKKRQQEEEEKAKKQREKEERLEKKKQEEEEKARKAKEREEKLERKRQEEEEKEQRKKEAEEKAKAANRKSVDFMSRFLGKPAAKPAAPLQPAAPPARAPADCAASPSAAAESGEPGPACSTPKNDRGASPDVALDDCGDDATSTTNAHAQRVAGPASAAARLKKEAGGPPRLFLPPPDSVFAHSTCARALEPVNPSAMDRELAVHWKGGPSVSADTLPHASAQSGRDKGADNAEAHLGAVPEAEAEGAGDAAASTGEVPAPGSCGSQASAGIALGASSATALPEGCGQEALIWHFLSHFRQRRGSSSRNAGAGTNSRSSMNQGNTGNNWRLRRLPKQVAGNVQSSPLKKQGSSAAGAKGTKISTKVAGNGGQGEGEDEEDDDELWSLMGPAARQNSADDDVMELVPQSSGDAEDGKAQSTLTGKRRKRRVKKLLQFHDNSRPAYYGTHSLTSTAVTARRPLAKEPILEYDVDSDEEWEDIPDDQGESLSDSDGEDEDLKDGQGQGDEDGDGEEDEEDGFVVPDGYLSDDEGVEHGPKPKPQGEQAVDAGQEAAKSQATAAGGEGTGPRKDAAAAPVETAEEAKQRRLQLLEKAVQRALKCGRPLVISALRTQAAPVQSLAGGDSLASGPAGLGTHPLGTAGDAAASSAAASAKAQLEYLQALSIEIVTPGVVVTVPPCPLTAAAEERPSKKPKHRQQPLPALQQQHHHPQQQQVYLQPVHRTPLKGSLPGHRMSPGHPGAGVPPASMPPPASLPPLPMPGGDRQHLRGSQFAINPPAPCTPNTLQAIKQAPPGCPVSPVCLEGERTDTPRHHQPRQPADPFQ